MKKILLNTLLAFCFGFLAVSSVSADSRDDESGLYGILGLEGYSYNYKETYKGRFVMEDNGPMYGVYYAVGTHPVDSCFRIALEGRNAWSNYINYKSRDTGEAKGGKYFVFEPRLLGHFVFNCNEFSSIEGYSGLGGRFLTNDDRNQRTTTGHSGYFRKSTYTYVPIGMRFNHRMQNDLQFVVHAEYDLFVSGTQRSDIGGFTITNSQPKGYGARAGLEFRIPASSCNITYTIGGFVRYWNIEKSKNHYITRTFYVFEPKNRTVELGVRAGLIF